MCCTPRTLLPSPVHSTHTPIMRLIVCQRRSRRICCCCSGYRISRRTVPSSRTVGNLYFIAVGSAQGLPPEGRRGIGGLCFIDGTEPAYGSHHIQGRHCAPRTLLIIPVHSPHTPVVGRIVGQRRSRRICCCCSGYRNSRRTGPFSRLSAICIS